MEIFIRVSYIPRTAARVHYSRSAPPRSGLNKLADIHSCTAYNITTTYLYMYSKAGFGTGIKKKKKKKINNVALQTFEPFGNVGR